MPISPEDQLKISWIKDNMSTQSKWLKQDYVDFYNRDVDKLMEIIEKLKKGGKL